MPKVSLYVLVVVVGVGILTIITRGFHRTRNADQHVEAIHQGEILYSLPTLCNALPATTTETVPADALVINEDDWRQIEFVPAIARPATRRDLAKLHAFKVEHRKGPGWNGVFVRSDGDRALSSSKVPSATLAPLLRLASERGLAVNTLGRTVLVRNGFAVQIGPGVMLCGQKSDGRILALGLEFIGPQAKLGPVEGKLQSFCDEAKVDLVDWYGERVVLDASAGAT